MMDISIVVNIKCGWIEMAKRNPNKSFAKWNAFAEKMNEITAANKCTRAEAARLIGYAGDNHFSEWQNKDEVPWIAMYAAQFIIALITKRNTVSHDFSDDDMAVILAMAAGMPTSADKRKHLLGVIAAKYGAAK